MTFPKLTIFGLFCFLAAGLNVAFGQNQTTTTATPIFPALHPELSCPGYKGCTGDGCTFTQRDNDSLNQQFIWGQDFNVYSAWCGEIKIEIDSSNVKGGLGNASMYCEVYTSFNNTIYANKETNTSIIVADITLSNKPNGGDASQIKCSYKGMNCVLVSSDNNTARFLWGMPSSCTLPTTTAPPTTTVAPTTSNSAAPGNSSSSGEAVTQKTSGGGNSTDASVKTTPGTSNAPFSAKPELTMIVGIMAFVTLLNFL